MLFPWVGMFEQVRQSTVFVHYDDVQFSKGSFTNRVQIKTAAGSKWLTIPLPGLKLGQAIRDIPLENAADWTRKHLAFLDQSFTGAPHKADAMELASEVYERRGDSLADVTIASMEAVSAYFGITPPEGFVTSSSMAIEGRSSQRVLDIVLALGGDRYVTGHGAKHYLDHELFERNGVAVEYMAYELRPYPQLHGEFTPYVSALDLIANMGRAGREVIASGTIGWREALKGDL